MVRLLRYRKPEIYKKLEIQFKIQKSLEIQCVI